MTTTRGSYYVGILKRKTRAYSIVTVLFIIMMPFQNCGPGYLKKTDLIQIDFSSIADTLAAPVISLTSEIPMLSNLRTLFVGLQVVTDAKATIATVTCKVDAQPVIDCKSLQLNLSNLTDGDHVLRINATDNKGTIAQEKIINFRIDATAPLVTISQAPPAVTGSTSATIVFQSTDALSPIKSTMCSRDGGAYTACTSPLVLTGISAGAHTLRILAVDSANNNSLDVTASWTVDLSAPILMISAAPSAFSNSKTANFSFSGTSGGVALASYECSQDGGAFAVCSSPATVGNLAEGKHTFNVRGKNSVGAVSSPVQTSWTVDSVPPSMPVLTADVAASTTQTSANISFTSSDATSMVKSFQCSMNSATFVDCSSPKLFINLPLASHTLQVRALDNANNTSTVGAFNWQVVAPAPVVLNGPALYATNCAGCHNALADSTKFNRTAVQIKDAIASVGRMAHLSTLSAAEVNAIAQALVLKNDGLANPFTCNNEVGITVLRRLTKREYTNTALDLFSGNLAVADIQQEINSIEKEFTNAIPSIRLFDSTNPISISLPLLKAYFQTAIKAADTITASSAKMTAIGGACMAQATVADLCVTAFLDNFGLRAMRRPLTALEKTNFLNLYRTGISSAESMARVIQGLMMTSQFMYKMEINGTAVNGRSDLFQLDGYEIASRISYAILGSMPDQALLDAAKTGGLTTAAGIQTQVDRIFGLAKAKTGIRDFYSQWLRLNYIPDINVPAAAANGIDLATFKNESQQEMLELMDYLIWTQKSNYQGLMTTKVAFPRSANLAKVYGTATATAAVQLADPNRAGIMTRAGMLAVDSGGRSGPIKRGVHARLHMLCDPLGAPPANAEQLASAVDPLASTRDQVATKTSATQCMACHSRINPAGFAFENFDGFGRFRTEETVSANGQMRTHLINSTINPLLTPDSTVTVTGAAAFQAEMANSSTAQACMVKQWMQYNTGRDANASDNCALAPMYDAVNKTGGSVLEMLKSYTRTSHFTMKKLGPLQ